MCRHTDELLSVQLVFGLTHDQVQDQSQRVLEVSLSHPDIGGGRMQLILGHADVRPPARELGGNPEGLAAREAAARGLDLSTDEGAAELKRIDDEVKKVIQEAAEFAQRSPEPDPSELWTDVLAEA